MIDYVYFLAWYPICIDDVQCSCFFFFIFFYYQIDSAGNKNYYEFDIVYVRTDGSKSHSIIQIAFVIRLKIL